jgi:hypothetical protein
MIHLISDSIFRCTVLLAAICGAWLSPVAFANDRPITDLIPADCLVMYKAKPYGWLESLEGTSSSTSRPTGAGASISSIIALLNASGLIPDEGQVFADIATALPLLGRFEHALVLLEVSSKIVEHEEEAGSAEDDSPQISLRLRNMQAAVIFRTRGEHKAVIEQLNRIIGRYTNQDVAKLTSGEIQGFSYQRLADSRLTGWAVWEWGRMDDFYVLSFGEGAFESVAKAYKLKAPSISVDPWYVQANKETQGGSAIAQWMIAFDRLKTSLGPQAGGRFEAVTKALTADDVGRDLWTIGAQGRALTCYRCFRKDNKDTLRKYSDPDSYPPEHQRIIPKGARHLAVVSVPTSWLVDNLPRAWLASQSPSNTLKWRRVWRELERETGIGDIGGSLTRHFGEHVVLFDYPPHPLNIPFALTAAIEIDNQQAVAMATDALLEAWGRYLDERAERNNTTLVRVKVKHDADGIWYLQAGILGPAMKVTSRYLVISWSPQALREVLKYIEPAKDSQTAP